MTRDVVIGLGNRFLHDDAAGIRVAERLKGGGALGKRDDIEITEYEEMDLSLLQELKGASRLIIVDSMKSGTEPGTVSLFRVADVPQELESIPSLHELDLSDIIRLAQRTGLLECEVLIVGIEPADLSLGEGLSGEVESAIPRAVSAVMERLSASDHETKATTSRG